MPDITQVLKKKKSFSKVAYRAWNFSSESGEESNINNNKFTHEEQEITKYTIDNNQIIKKNIIENENQGVSKALASQQQGVSKALASQQQGVSKALASQQQGVSKALASQQQGVSNPVSKDDLIAGVQLIIPATGKELKLLLFLHQSCVNNCSLITNEITTKDLNGLLCVNSNRLRNLVLRLSKKKLIKVVMQNCDKNNAYRIFEFSKEIYDKLLSKKTLINANNSPSQALATPLASQYVVSSNINITTNYIPEEFEKIDISPLNDIGFDKSHMIQIYREHKKNPEVSLSADIIQNSINAFAFDLKHNEIITAFKSSPAVVLTSLLKKGQPYSSKTPEKVLTPQEEAMQDYLLAQQKKQQKVTEIKTKARELALQEWLDSLSEEELLNFNQELRPEGIPDRVYQKSRRKKAEELAKDYFDAVLWPKKLKQILNSQASVEVQT